MTSGFSPQQSLSSVSKPSLTSGGPKHNQQREASGRIIKTILLNKQNQSEQQNQIPYRGDTMDRRPPRPSNVPPLLKDSNGVPDDLHGFYSEKQDKRSTRNKDRPDRGVWTPLRRSDASDESLSSANSQGPPDSAEGVVIYISNNSRGGKMGG